MPWRTKRFVGQILLAVVVLVLSIIILVRNRSLDVDLLAVIGLVGGLAILLTALPANGTE
jgi:hypothetical protein